MERINHILRVALPALVAALMAGCVAFVAVCALGFAPGWLPVYGLALAAAAVVGLGRRGMKWALIAAALLAAGFAVLLADGAGSIGGLLRAFAENRGLSAEELLAHAAAGRSIALLAALLLGMLFALLLKSPSGMPPVLMTMLVALVCSLAANESLSLWLAVPGLVAGVAAFGMNRDGLRPLLLLPAAVLVILALLLVPGERTTWTPMENLAARVRSIVEDYIRFTEERMAFSINEKGYNHAQLIGEDVVAMLGGPANPSDDAVMRVETDHDLLLRGTIKHSYTGYSWIDDQAKARYLYYDFTHRGVRSDVFSAEMGGDDSRFASADARVEILEPGTSTLFVPSPLAEFDMDLSNAVYYNSVGEMFLTRDVEPGDSYALSTRLPADDASLVAAARDALSISDRRYAEMLAAYTALPEGIDARVYALAVELTRDASTPAEKALAIQEYLMKNYAYTLDGRSPGADRDFVSWFLLEEKQGYCSYFASAMAVLSRIAGLPARYVEGYYVRANEGGETVVTGENAHAWVEIYLNGLGWMPFDPTARAYEYQNGAPDAQNPDTSDGESSGETPFENEDPLAGAPTPSPTPDIGSDPGDDSAGEPTPTPDPGDGAAQDDPTPSPSPDNSGDSDAPDVQSAADETEEQPPHSRAWLWILLALLVLLALLALAYLWVRRRLNASDPMKLCASARSSQQAALILYRGVLTLLLQAGLMPQSGETPEAFALRAAQTLPNPFYEAFVSEVVRSRYSGKPLTREALELGRRAYLHFLDSMRFSERIRYHLRRMLHGIGDLESIP